MGRLLLRGPVATGILDPYAPAVLPFRPTNPPRGRFPLLKIYEPTLNGVVRATSRTVHTFRGFVATREPEKPGLAKYNRVCTLSPFVVYHGILTDLPRIRATDYAAPITN